MILFKRANDITAYIRQQQASGLRIGMVPTMGALHQGHLSLLEASKKNTNLTVCSIFVNPTQFNDPGDFQKYPVTLEKDIYALEKISVDILFLPDVADIYPRGVTGLEHYDLGYLDHILEGQYRPGHFQGVCQVMNRLLTIVQPDQLYMGQKDYQQCMVVKKLLEIMRSTIVLHTCATLREPDGLAMSSRNMRLSEPERKKAPAIYQSLLFLKKNLRQGNLSELVAQAGSLLKENDFSVDYVAIANAATLEPVLQWDGQEKLVALIAAYQRDVRLIDNMLMNS